jgi:hypothetical protein
MGSKKPFKTLLVLAAMAFLIMTLPASVQAQSVQGDPADISFDVVNATKGEPGTIDRLEIHYITQRMNAVLDVEPQGSEFTIPEVPIKDIGRYVITAWKSGVPYFWSIRGRQILAETITLHVFDTSSDLSDVSIAGLNLLLRKGESVVNLEYMLKINNDARPQVTITGSPTLALRVPSGATDFKAHYTRGPDPIDVPVTTLGSDQVGLVVPLTSDQNQIRLECSLPWSEGMEVPVGSNVPVISWSLLATPENLDIRSYDLEQDRGQDLPGYLRFIGPELEADQEFRFQVRGRIPTGTAEEVFTTDSPAESAEQDEDTGESGSSGFPFAVLVPIFVVLIILVVRLRKS